MDCDIADENDIKSEVLASQMEVQNIDHELGTIETEINRLLSQQKSLQTKKQKLQKTVERLQHQLKTKDLKWDTDKHPWSEKLFSLLQQQFHLDGFRPLQKETMNVTLSNIDCILIMPTGGGKSLCFQLPALLSDGFTLVRKKLVFCYVVVVNLYVKPYTSRTNFQRLSY